MVNIWFLRFQDDFSGYEVVTGVERALARCKFLQFKQVPPIVK